MRIAHLTVVPFLPAHLFAVADLSGAVEECRSPNHGPRSSSSPQTLSLPWAAATPARFCPASTTRTGNSTIRPIRDEIRDRVNTHREASQHVGRRSEQSEKPCRQPC